MELQNTNTTTMIKVYNPRYVILAILRHTTVHELSAIFDDNTLTKTAYRIFCYYHKIHIFLCPT